ncbi:MAG: hypothetical protein AAGA37_10865 [Actinomycetota bacterium]
MNTKTLALILLRRWKVAVPIFVVALVFAIVNAGSPSHSVEVSFLLVTPSDVSGESDDANTNPILSTPSEVRSVANVVVITMQTDSRRLEVEESGYSLAYEFSVARTDPFVSAVVIDDTAEGAVESAIVLSQLFIEEMTQQQIRFGADAGALVRAELLEISEPLADYSGVRATQAIIVFLGLTLAVFAAFAIEGARYFFSDRRIEYREMLVASAANDQLAQSRRESQPVIEAGPERRLGPSVDSPSDSDVDAGDDEVEGDDKAAAGPSRGSRWERS